MEKQRNYMYDAVRGLCMFLIPLQHFIGAGEYCNHGEFGGLIYVTVDIFALQAFFFLSGMFSKKPERSREIAFKALLWPLIMSYVIFWLLSWIRSGSFEYSLGIIKFGNIPYGMWFMAALFVYRMFQKNYIKVPHLFGLAFILYLISGCFGFLSKNFYAESRIITFFISFLLGYYMTQEQVEKLRRLKGWQTALLGIVLIGISILVAYVLPESFSKAIQLKATFASIGMTWWQGILTRAAIFVVSFGWIVFLMNIMSNKKGFWAWIGMNTMPIYIFHLGFVAFVRKYGITFGLFPEVEKDPILYYIVVFAFSTVLTIILATKPVGKIYSFIFDGSYSLFMWVLTRVICPFGGIIEKGLCKCYAWIVGVPASEVKEPIDVEQYRLKFEKEMAEQKEAKKQKKLEKANQKASK